MENIEKCGTCRCNKICDHNKYGFENCGNYISADVVPKSEVDEIMGKYDDLKLKYVDLQKDKAELIAWANDKKNEVAREIFSELEKLHLHITNEFDARRYAELKKKYIGE